MVRASAIEHVERERALLVFGIEIDNIVGPVSRNVVFENLLYQLAVRINHCNAVACGNIPGEHISEERTLTGT